MSITQSVRQSARAAGNSRPLELLTRAGFLGYGVLHLAVAWLALQIAHGRQARESDQSGAFMLLGQQPLGRFLLIFIAVGLAAMALWQLILAAVGHRQERGLGRAAERLASLGRTVIYAALAWSAQRVVANAAASGAEQQQQITARMLAHPTGRWLIGLAGLGILALGIGMAIYGALRKFEKRLRMAQMSAQVQRLATRLGQIGYIAKGVAFGIVGVLVISAAVNYDPAKSRGLDGALRSLDGKPYGTLLLLLIAVGFAAFGVYCFFQSKYRKV